MKKMAAIVMMGMLFFSVTIKAEEKASAAQEPIRDEQAIDRLVSIGKYLRTLKVFAIHADTLSDEVLDNGQKVQFAGTTDYLVQGSARARIDVKNDYRQRIYTYDGKTVTQYAPQLKYYAQIDFAGETIQAISYIRKKYNIEMPLVDLFLWGTDAIDLKDITEAGLVGVERINGRDSQHFAYRKKGVDWQIWIPAGEKSLPVKLVFTDTTKSAQPSYLANLQWHLSPKVNKKDFTFIPPKGAAKIDIVAAHPGVKE